MVRIIGEKFEGTWYRHLVPNFHIKIILQTLFHNAQNGSNLGKNIHT